MLEKIRQHFANPINKKAVSITALALIALAIPLTVFISQQQQEIRQRAQEVTTKGGGEYVSLTLAPSILEKAPGETFDVEFYFEAKTFSITGVDVTINYDPSILQMERFTPVSTFNNVLVNNPPDNTKGEYRYAAVDTANTPQTGKITVGIITFKAQNTTGTSYVDLNNIQITALGQSTAIPTADNTQGKYVVATTPTAAPTAIATPEPIAACSALYNKVVKASTTSCNNGSYDSVADLNKDGRVGVDDYSLLLKDSDNLKNNSVCTNYLNSTINPCAATPSASPTPLLGDANGDGNVDILDFNIWRDEFLGKSQTKQSDFNKDERVDLLDFSIWRNAFGQISHPPITTAPTIEPSPPPTSGFGKAVLITSNEIERANLARIYPNPFNNSLSFDSEFTIEYWFKFNKEPVPGERLLKFQNGRLIIGVKDVSSYLGGYQLYITSSDGANTRTFYPLASVTPGRWNHIAVTNYVANNVNNIVFYFNGQYEQTNLPFKFDSSNRLVQLGKFLDGQIDEVRVSNNRRYPIAYVNNSTYTVPTTPFTSDSNTMALIHFDGQLKDATGNNNDAELTQDITNYPVNNVQFVNSTILVTSQ